MKRALVIGCGNGVWDEVAAAQALCPGDFDTIYCVKMSGIHWRGQFVWITLHPEFMDDYKQQREKNGLPPTFEIVGPLENELAGSHGKIAVDRRVSYRWKGMNASGSSGLFAVKVAMEDGHNRIVLAGIPMQSDKQHFMRGKDWAHADSFWLTWLEQKNTYSEYVRSMSGRTRELLGAPTAEWLA